MTVNVFVDFAVMLQIASDNQAYSILLQNAETVALVSPVGGNLQFCFIYSEYYFLLTIPCIFHILILVLLISTGEGYRNTAIPVTSLKVGDEVLLRLQGGARHTGIEIEEFIVEK